MRSGLWYFLLALLARICIASYAIKLNATILQVQQYSNTSLPKSLLPRISSWTYLCEDNKCVKHRHRIGDNFQSLTTCNMICSRPQVWPLPSKRFRRSRHSLRFYMHQIRMFTDAADPAKGMLKQAFNIFYENIVNLIQPTYGRLRDGDVGYFNININVSESTVSRLKLQTDEGYRLALDHIEGGVSVRIEAQTFFGARHALETLSQLVWWDEFSGMLRIFDKVYVEDAPKFPYRGLMIDTARNYIPMHLIKKAVIGMAASKLNVLHLHLTDTQSFPLTIPGLELFSDWGAYGSDMIYTVDDILELVEYCRIRGIRVVMEVDAPSHVRSGWEWGEEEGLGKLVMCNEEPFGGQLNPDNPNSLNLLQQIYAALLQLNGDDEIFHIGGDEVDLNCWASTHAAEGFIDMRKFWANYTSRMLDRLKKANGNVSPQHTVMWSSPLTSSNYINSIEGHENITVQFWLGNPSSFLRAGYKVIYSTVGHWYLDCGFNRWRPGMHTGTCDPYTPWQTFYEYRPWVVYDHREQALGGEACLWTEQVEVDSFETRLWPRVAAFAERVWSDPLHLGHEDVYTRLSSHRERLLGRGLKVAAMWPRWCTQHPGEC